MFLTKIFLAALVSCLAFLGSLLLQETTESEDGKELLPSASQVIEKYVMESGGYEALGSVESSHFVFKGVSSNGSKLASEYFQARGKYYCTIRRNGFSMTRGVWADGTLDEDGVRTGLAWQSVNGGQLTHKTGDELQEYLRRRFRVISSPYWQEDFVSIRCIAKADVRGKPTWQLRFVDHDGKEIDRFFDVRTGYLLRRKTMESFDGSMHEVTRDYMGHQKKGGIVVAMDQTISHADIVETWHVESVEYDVEIPEGTFEVPATIQRQIESIKQKQAEMKTGSTGSLLK